jgi:hypothetical protein
MNYERTARISLLAAEMAILFTPGHNTTQSPEFEAKRAEYLWEEHVRIESDKFDPPYLSDHRFG